jgi:prostaglandin-H2 D-isomerase / glutathione transferase
MPKLKLTYFDFHGGRGEPARLALSIGGIPFEDDRVAPSDWQRRKPDTPFGALPVLEVDGRALAQSNAINHYVGTLTAYQTASFTTLPPGDAFDGMVARSGAA